MLPVAACLLSKFLSGLLAKWKAVCSILSLTDVIVQEEGRGKVLLLSDKSFS